MDKNDLIGMRVRSLNTHYIGTIEYIQDGIVAVNFHGDISKYQYPAAFATTLELEDENAQIEIESDAVESSFEIFKRNYKFTIKNEINFLKANGGKKYKIIDGEKISSKNGEYLYAFDTDSELHFPDGTAIKLWFPDNIINAYIVSCEDFTILIKTMEYIGDNVESVEFTSEQWQLLEALMERIDDMIPAPDSLAYQISCNGKKHIKNWQTLKSGQNVAFNMATSEKITFIWGPPGTGKTETLADIAVEHMLHGRRVLMLSYSNVSVDGALIRVAKKSDFPEGQIIRYGYPRTKELLESKTLTSYQFVLSKNPELALKYQQLIDKKQKLRKKDPGRIEINRKINRIREFISDQEKELIQKTAFTATTISKATVDKAIYSQVYDVVIFDEASMAYVPQIVFAAGLAKSFFVCLGDFCQLPAIVQNNNDKYGLKADIFEYTGITQAVTNNQGHDWLVMLDMQYRMHHDIADFVSVNMYGGRLKTSDRIYESRNEIASCCPCPNEAMSLINLGGMYSVCIKTMDKSRINILSSLICMRLAEKFIGQYEVGIITPYNAQSRLILSMIRDMQEKDKRWEKVSCATVHQFQGSEKPVIIYDAVDCFRMTYPGTLLTSLENDTANRLFNVAVTRAKGKFILVANMDFFKRKRISKKLIFTKAMNKLIREEKCISGGFLLDELMPSVQKDNSIYIEDREISFSKYIEDITNSKTHIQIDIPDVIDENDDAVQTLTEVLKTKHNEGVEISIRVQDNIDIPVGLQIYAKRFPYVTNPLTIIDKKILWFGQPLYSADFISEGEILDTEYFPCVRFEGMYSVRAIKMFLEL